MLLTPAVRDSVTRRAYVSRHKLQEARLVVGVVLAEPVEGVAGQNSVQILLGDLIGRVGLAHFSVRS